MIDTTDKSDRERLRLAFAALRRRGWLARMDFLCCQSCGWAALERIAEERKTKPTGMVFWHNQDDEAFQYQAYRNAKDDDLHRPLYLAFGGNGWEIVATLREYGLTVEWDGDDSKRIAVMPRPENDIRKPL